MCEYCQYDSELLRSADMTVKIDAAKCRLFLIEETYHG